MRWKIILVFFVTLIALITLFLALSALFGEKNGNIIPPATSFRGPSGEPFIKGPPGPPPSDLFRECPDEWIENRMPHIDERIIPSEYFIFEGARRELYEFDIDWIKENCNLKPLVVY